MTKTTRTLLGGLLLAAATVGAWWAWLGWESGYTVDPETGATSGPYAVWQVAAAVLTLIVIAASQLPDKLRVREALDLYRSFYRNRADIDELLA
ncbi:hypothetical protein ABZ591_09745, partial [Micromonospora fulviviridis]